MALHPQTASFEHVVNTTPLDDMENLCVGIHVNPTLLLGVARDDLVIWEREAAAAGSTIELVVEAGVTGSFALLLPRLIHRSSGVPFTIDD